MSTAFQSSEGSNLLVRRLRYFNWLARTFPRLPRLYREGKQVRSGIVKLPEATGTEGRVPKQGGKIFRLLTLGESTVAGVGVDTHDLGFSGSLAASLSRELEVDVQWRVIGRSGFNVKQVREELVPAIPEENVDLIVLGLGGNDTFEFNTPWRWGQELRGLIRAIRAVQAHPPIVFANMPPVRFFPAFTPLMQATLGDLVDLLREELVAVVRREEHTWFYDRPIDPEDWIQRLDVKAEPGDFFSDGVHPSELTYRVWGADMVDFMVERGVFGDRR